MKVLFIINDPPYGTERVYNALRLALALLKRDSTTQLTTFLMADAVLSAKPQQKTPEGYYNVERLLKQVLSNKGSVLLCGTCPIFFLASGTKRPNVKRVTYKFFYVMQVTRG